jgi:hypothetical protein
MTASSSLTRIRHVALIVSLCGFAPELRLVSRAARATAAAVERSLR